MQTILIISVVLAVPGWVAYLLVSRRRCIRVLESRYSPEGAFGPLKEYETEDEAIADRDMLASGVYRGMADAYRVRKIHRWGRTA
jgi:hypothetical protein